MKKEPEGAPRSIIWIGIFLTLAYMLALPALFRINLDRLQALEPDKLGSFLSGVFSPIGLIWIVLTFILQQRQLSLQHQELKASVEQITAQTKIMGDSLEHNVTARAVEYALQEIEAMPTDIYRMMRAWSGVASVQDVSVNEFIGGMGDIPEQNSKGEFQWIANVTQTVLRIHKNRPGIGLTLKNLHQDQYEKFLRRFVAFEARYADLKVEIKRLDERMLYDKLNEIPVVDFLSGMRIFFGSALPLVTEEN